MFSTRLSRLPSDATTTGLDPVHKTDIKINVYDLLPPGRLSNIFWTFGVGLLHTGVVIADREYAFGGHDRRGLTGVYWMKPRQEPPGGTFRVEHIHGTTYSSPERIDNILREISEEYLGPTYNVLTRNCNHFTNELCKRLTGRPAPAWINRAAGIGVALPCVVPDAWIAPPECEEEAMLVEEDLVGSQIDTLQDDRWTISDDGDMTDEDMDTHKDAKEHTVQGRARKVMDEDGRLLPTSERANIPTIIS